MAGSVLVSGRRSFWLAVAWVYRRQASAQNRRAKDANARILALTAKARAADARARRLEGAS